MGRKVRQLLSWVAAVFCLSVHLLIAGTRLDNYALQRRAERLLVDIRSLELRRSTFSDAQSVADRWISEEEQKDPANDPGATPKSRSKISRGASRGFSETIRESLVSTAGLVVERRLYELRSEYVTTSCGAKASRCTSTAPLLTMATGDDSTSHSSVTSEVAPLLVYLPCIRSMPLAALTGAPVA
jgi:hypothetical protein